MAKWTRRRILSVGAAGGVAALAGGALTLTGSGGDIARPGRGRARPVATDARPPTAADVVIVGGGLIGVTTAFYLARQGISVVLCEKGVIAGEASGRAQGQVSSAGLAPFKLDLINLAKRLWLEMNAAVEGETGYRRCGFVGPFVDGPDSGMWGDWLREAGAGAPAARLVGAAEANALVPAATRWSGAFHDPTDGSAEPTLAAPAIAEAARRHGARLVAPCAVRGFETQAGRISHVVTEHGAIRTATVVLCGGAWSTLFAENSGLRLPSMSVFSTQLHVDRLAGPTSNASLQGLDLRLQIDGSYTVGATMGHIAITPAVLRNLWAFRKVIAHPPWDVHPNLSGYFFRELVAGRRWAMDEVSPFESNRVLEPENNMRLVQHLRQELKRQYPAAAALRELEVWSGALNLFPDNVPVISRVETIPGLVLGTGFSYGITMGPAAGLLLSELVSHATPSVDLRPYRYERFVDGSELTLTH